MRTLALVTARNEAERLPATLHALRATLPGIELVVADDGSSDGTAARAAQAGARVVRAPRGLGKGGAATLAARTLPSPAPPDGAVVLLCDADLGPSAAELRRLVDAVAEGRCDLAVAAFARREGGGFGLAVGYARWAIARRTGRRLAAPISGQRALRATALGEVLPFAAGFGMELGMTVDALRAGLVLEEVELELVHRATGRTPAGFAHRARQLRDFVRADLDRR